MHRTCLCRVRSGGSRAFSSTSNAPVSSFAQSSISTPTLTSFIGIGFASTSSRRPRISNPGFSSPSYSSGPLNSFPVSQNPRSLPRRIQRRDHGNHSHSHSHGAEGHHHHALPELLDPSKDGSGKGLLQDPGSRITLVGFGSNIALTLAKTWAGIQYNSSALLADAIHSASDMLSDILTLITLRLSVRTPKRLKPYFPHGLPKIEPFGSVIVSGLLILGGIHVAKESLGKLWSLWPPAVHAHGGIEIHNTAAEVATASSTLVDPKALWIAVGTIVVKELLFRATLRIAESQKSDVLKASAWHHRVDSLSTLVAVGSIGLSTLGFRYFDPIGGLLVSALVLRAGAQTTRSSILRILDASKPVTESFETCLKYTPPPEGIRITSMRRLLGKANTIELRADVRKDLELWKVDEWRREIQRRWREVLDGEDEIVLLVRIEGQGSESENETGPIQM